MDNLSRFPWQQSPGALSTEARASASPFRCDPSQGACPLGLRGRQDQRRERQAVTQLGLDFTTRAPNRQPLPPTGNPQQLAQSFLFLPHLGGGGCENDPPLLPKLVPDS